MKAILISLGDELILGQSVDTNSAWLSEQLASLGIAVLEHITVGDNLNTIVSALRRAGESADLLIGTGGLGPTDDDLTRQAVAQVLGVNLVLHEESLEQIRQFFARRQWNMAKTNNVQAMFPQGAVPLPNPVGTAPGFTVKIRNAQAYFLPGVPREMQRMYEMNLASALKQKMRQETGGQVIVTRLLHTVGIGESSLAEKLGDRMARGRNPLLNCTAKAGQVTLRINATANTEELAHKMIGPVEQDLRDLLGNSIFGADGETLEEAVGKLLRQKRRTLATAESCTGGLLAKLITDVPGSSDYFLNGWICYSNESKIQLLRVAPDILARHGAVSEPVARQLAESARTLSKADYALSVTGIAGPGGGSAEKPVGLVYIALAHPAGGDVQQWNFAGERQTMRQRTAVAALNLLRLKLLQ